MQLPAPFLTTPLAHRGLHARAEGRPENSRAALRAAIAGGYGAEIDVQLSADGQAMVFHDYVLSRLTGKDGAIRRMDAEGLATIPLLGGAEGIPTLTQVLELVAGRVPLLIEIKDQDGALGPRVGALERAVASALLGYTGPVAVMSFNPHSVIALRDLAPAVPRGLVSCSFDERDWPFVPQAHRDALRRMRDFNSAQACFISHQAEDLGSLHVKHKRDAGIPVLCWTIRSAEQETTARRIAQNITFEGYAPHKVTAGLATP